MRFYSSSEFWFVRDFQKEFSEKKEKGLCPFFPSIFFRKSLFPARTLVPHNLLPKLLDSAHYISPKKAHYDLKFKKSFFQLNFNRLSEVIKNCSFISGRDAHYERYLGSNVCSCLTRILNPQCDFFQENDKIKCCISLQRVT